MENLRINGRFPCPVCTRPLEVKLTKKDKPYMTCDPCGVQVFIRGPAGIGEFARLLERGNRDGLPERLAKMERRYRLTCPECGNKFWVEPGLVNTSIWTGSLHGLQCPQKGCGAIVPWEGKR